MPTLVRERPELGELIGKAGETLTETLRRTLLEMIIFGYFKRGARLYPEKIAEHFGVSLTPVREALMRLAAEGFIETIQRRGYHVRNPDAKQVLELWQVRLAMELMAGEIMIDRLASGALGDSAIEQMQQIQARLEADPETITHKDHHELNGSFHQLVVEFSDNKLLIAAYRGIQMQVLSGWIQRGLESWRTRHVSDSNEHRAILAALRARDKDAYAKAMRNHLSRSLKDALADLAIRNQNDIEMKDGNNPSDLRWRKPDHE